MAGAQIRGAVGRISDRNVGAGLITRDQRTDILALDNATYVPINENSEIARISQVDTETLEANVNESLGLLKKLKENGDGDNVFMLEAAELLNRFQSDPDLLAKDNSGEPAWLSLLDQIADAGTTMGQLTCLLYTSPSPRDATLSRMPSSA